MHAGWLNRLGTCNEEKECLEWDGCVISKGDSKNVILDLANKKQVRVIDFKESSINKIKKAIADKLEQE